MSDDILIEYFLSRRPYKVILERLHAVHGIHKSMSWLKRKLRKLGLKKRCPDPPEDEIKALIQGLLVSPDNLRGYRAIWQILLNKYHIFVRRDTVMKLLRELDPDGVDRRKGRRLKRRLYHSKGPNYIWHLDGYEKLSPYGLSIHGCIDGKIIWLRLSPSNRNPAVIARYYLESIEKAGGCPRVLRADLGTENCTVAKIHIAFRMDHDDSMSGNRSFIYGPSTANTRIEAWWSILRKFKVDWWMELCRSLVAEGYFNKHDDIHRYSLAYVFGSLLDKDLTSFVDEWNNHPIRKNHQASSPHGRPNDIYEMPSLHGTTDQLQSISPTLWANCMLHESATPQLLCPSSFKDICDDVLRVFLCLSIKDVSHSNCRSVYLQLVRKIKLLVDNGMFRMPLHLH